MPLHVWPVSAGMATLAADRAAENDTHSAGNVQRQRRSTGHSTCCRRRPAQTRRYECCPSQFGDVMWCTGVTMPTRIRHTSNRSPASHVERRRDSRRSGNDDTIDMSSVQRSPHDRHKFSAGPISRIAAGRAGTGMGVWRDISATVCRWAPTGEKEAPLPRCVSIDRRTRARHVVARRCPACRGDFARAVGCCAGRGCARAPNDETRR